MSVRYHIHFLDLSNLDHFCAGEGSRNEASACLIEKHEGRQTPLVSRQSSACTVLRVKQRIECLSTMNKFHKISGSRSRDSRGLWMPWPLCRCGIVSRHCEPTHHECCCQTSSSFHALLSTGSLWEEKLRQTCIVDSLFLPSYPIESMSLHELQRAAVAPCLWRRRVSRGVIRDMDEFYESVDASPDRYATPTPLFTQSTYGAKYAFIVPGGRFVISAPLLDRSIYCYDLGLPINPNPTPREPVAKVLVSLNRGYVLSMSFCVVPVGEALRSVILLNCGHERG